MRMGFTREVGRDMETTNERDLRIMTGLADIMPALTNFALTVKALDLSDADAEALYTAVTKLYRAGYAAGRRARPTDATVLDAE